MNLYLLNTYFRLLHTGIEINKYFCHLQQVLTTCDNLSHNLYIHVRYFNLGGNQVKAKKKSKQFTVNIQVFIQ